MTAPILDQIGSRKVTKKGTKNGAKKGTNNQTKQGATRVSKRVSKGIPKTVPKSGPKNRHQHDRKGVTILTPPVVLDGLLIHHIKISRYG